MPTGTLRIVATLGGVAIDKQISRSADHLNIYEAIPLPAGKAGTLSVRGGNTTGTAAMATGHGIVTGKVDVYWEGGLRYGVDGVVTGDNVALSNGSGDNLPDQDTALVVSTPVEIETAIDGDAVKLIAMAAAARGHLDMQDAADATIKALELLANQPWTWFSDSGIANPLSGNPITKSMASNGTTEATTITIVSLEDSTP